MSEALALDVAHLELNGSSPHVKVRRSLNQRCNGFGPPKSKYGKREVPLPAPLVHELREHVARLGPAHKTFKRLVFPSEAGTPMSPDNLRRRVLRPTMGEVGCEWAGYHAFRHSFASMNIERGTNMVRLSRLLGHHSPAFTLERYGHLLDDRMGEPLDIDAEIANGVQTSRTETGGVGNPLVAHDSPV